MFDTFSIYFPGASVLMSNRPRLSVSTPPTNVVSLFSSCTVALKSTLSFEASTTVPVTDGFCADALTHETTNIIYIIMSRKFIIIVGLIFDARRMIRFKDSVKKYPDTSFTRYVRACRYMFH